MISLEILTVRESPQTGEEPHYVLVSDHGSAELSHLAGVLGQVNSTLEPVVKVSLSSPSSQDLGLDHVFGTGEIPGDLGSFVIVTRYSELLHGHSEVLELIEVEVRA